jgi:hypothetical protein
VQGKFLESGFYTDISDPLLRPRTMGLHFFAGFASRFCYENKNIIMDLALSVAESFNEIPHSIKQIQNSFIYNINNSYPILIQSDYNFIDNVEESTEYVVDSSADKKYGVGSKIKSIRKNRLGDKCFLGTTMMKEEYIDIEQKIYDAINKVKEKNNIIIKV